MHPAWSAFEVTERMGASPVVSPAVDVEVTSSQNTSTAIAAGTGARVRLAEAERMAPTHPMVAKLRAQLA